MQANHVAAAQSQLWIVKGVELFRRNARLWLAVSTLYVLLALILLVIPFIGYLVLVLLTPALAAGAGRAAFEMENNAASAPVGTLGERVRAWYIDAGRRLFHIFFHPDRTLSVMVVATFALGAIVLLQIVAQLLKVGGAALPAMVHGSVSASIWAPALLAVIVIWILKLAVTMVALFASFLIALHHEPPLAALETGVAACAKNLLPVSVLAFVFLVPLALLAYVHLAAALAAAVILLPLFINASLRAFRDLFPQRVRR